MSDRHETSARTGSRRVVAIDVGGTTLRAGLLDTATELLGSPLEISSPTAESYEAILDTFEQLVRRAAAGRRAAAVGIAMPGPFDYADGVSRMRHKLGALYGHPFGRDLERRLGVAVRFVNDADAFALGAWVAEFADVERFLGVTLGTGVGSGFLVGGVLVGAEEGVPSDTEIWDAPYRDGILEDQVSRRAIEAGYASHGGRDDAGVRAIADRARAGEPAALAVFGDLGEAVGDGLALAAGPFRPDVIAFGGKIALAYDVFGAQVAPAFTRRAGYSPRFALSHATDPALRGAGRVVLAG